VYRELILCKFQDLLTAASHNIFNLTKGRVQMKDITVQLPHSWHACAPATALVAAAKRAADVHLTSSHPLLGDMPWTVQFAGCQQPGRNIELPVGFLTKNKTMEEKGSMLAKEWVKLRFGVFEEAGFEGDSLYPSTFVEGKANLTNSGCNSSDQVCTGAGGWDEEWCWHGEPLIASLIWLLATRMTYASPN
jgi:hypothetical protein